MDTRLCSVCVEAESKYTCPLCSAKTCSLVCSRRHKLRTSCEGHQGPSAFKSKSDLHRPSQVAADFDFLNSIQRSLDRATDSHNGPPQPQPVPLLDDRIRETCRARGLVILPAPSQSSRAARNRSLYGPNNRIIWTIEWVFNSSTVATTEVDESLTVNEAFQDRILPSLPATPFPDTGTPPTFLYHLRAIEPQTQSVNLLPLAAQDILSNALMNATVLEFPTIQVSMAHE